MVSENQFFRLAVYSPSIDLDQHFGDVHAQIVGMFAIFVGLSALNPLKII